MSDHASEHEPRPHTTAKDGIITLVLTLALWGGLLGLTLTFGHLLANHMAAGHP